MNVPSHEGLPLKAIFRAATVGALLRRLGERLGDRGGNVHEHESLLSLAGSTKQPAKQLPKLNI